MTATCNDSTVGGTSTTCQSGIDSDGDGLNDDVECRLGSDPNNADTNGDGIPDGTAVGLGLDPTKLDTDGDGINDSVEVAYPKLCVAADHNLQRRPAISCTDATAASVCLPGESCSGLNPLNKDTDGDGVPDGQEDINVDGVIDFSVGETDPRLWDTDGDGLNDSVSGARICRPDGLGMVVQYPISAIQLGHDPLFGSAKAIVSPTLARKGAIVDEAATGTAGLVIVEPVRGVDNRADSQAYEGDIKTYLGGLAGWTISDVFVGRPFTTHEKLPAIHSTFLVTAPSTSASAVRDALVATLSGGSAPGGATAGSGNTAFYLDVTTVTRSSSLVDLIVVASPQPQNNDPKQLTGIRVDDLDNSTGVAEGTQTLDYVCQGVIASRLPTADFLWTVDISGSMANKQVAVGNAGTSFVNKLQAAGVDVRVGVFAAEGTTAKAVNFATVNAAGGWPTGFKMLPDPTMTSMLDRWLCRYVTAPASGATGFCPPDLNTTNDPYTPYLASSGGDEEPVAAAIRINDQFKKNAGGANPDWQWRANALKVAFFVTDEPTTNAVALTDANDWNRYFSTANNPDTNVKWSPTGVYSAQTPQDIATYFRNNQILTYGIVPVYSTRSCTASPNANDLPRCVIEANNGAYVDMANGKITQPQIDAAMDRIAQDIIGASSPIVLKRSPITSTIKVTVRGADVPRSRSDGFDYNQASKSIVFYGNTYRPALGDVVYVSYRVWKNSAG